MAECVFCGDYAGSSLRVPYGYMPGAGDHAPGADTLVDVPCCMECREILDEVSVTSLEGAARYLVSVYFETYAHLLADFKWTRNELDELGHNLRSFVEMSHKAHLEVWERLQRCERVAALGPDVPEDVMDDIEYEVRLKLEADRAAAAEERRAAAPKAVPEISPIEASEADPGPTAAVGPVAANTTGAAGHDGHAPPAESEPPEPCAEEEGPDIAAEAEPEEPAAPAAAVGLRRTSEGPMVELHDALAARYASLRAARGGLPVFCLEHGLDGEGRAQLVSLVGAEVRRRGVGHWWRDRYLPLLAAASETGYAVERQL